MVLPVLLLQLAVIEMQPIVPSRIYDVDVYLLRGADTLAMPLVRVSDGVEGRLMISQEHGPSVLFRTMVLQDRVTGCHSFTIGIGRVEEEHARTDNEQIYVPQTTGKLCGVEMIRMTNAGSGTVIARVRLAAKRPDQ